MVDYSHHEEIKVIGGAWEHSYITGLLENKCLLSHGLEGDGSENKTYANNLSSVAVHS